MDGIKGLVSSNAAAKNKEENHVITNWAMLMSAIEAVNDQFTSGSDWFGERQSRSMMGRWSLKFGPESETCLRVSPMKAFSVRRIPQI
jgi:hypothetical protein